MAKYFDRYIQTEDFKVPLRIYVERRKSVRASLGKHHIILRIPHFATSNLEKHLDFTIKWLYKLRKEHPEILDKYQLSEIEDSYVLSVLDKYHYNVSIQYCDEEHGKARLENFKLELKIPTGIDEFSQRRVIRELNSKMLAKVFKPYVVERVNKLNSQYFQSDVKGVTLRYNTSNWGSCSTSGRINISTRSLLLPEDVFEYILVHELAHTKEMNHSDRFWNVVEKVMPSYKEKEKYIKKYGKKLDF